MTKKLASRAQVDVKKKEGGKKSERCWGIRRRNRENEIAKRSRDRGERKRGKQGNIIEIQRERKKLEGKSKR